MERYNEFNKISSSRNNMTLNQFIKKLEKISEEHGSAIRVVMADDILVVDPVYCEAYGRHGNVVVITDQ